MSTTITNYCGLFLYIFFLKKVKKIPKKKIKTKFIVDTTATATTTTTTATTTTTTTKHAVINFTMQTQKSEIITQKTKYRKRNQISFPIYNNVFKTE